MFWNLNYDFLKNIRDKTLLKFCIRRERKKNNENIQVSNYTYEGLDAQTEVERTFGEIIKKVLKQFSLTKSQAPNYF